MKENSFLPHIVQIPELCFQAGIRRCIISPGSRNAPLTSAFVRHSSIETYLIPDERSAAFIGLGMALKSSEPTVLVCTSGTAVLNYFPAIAEALYQEIPLLVLTADRPNELLDRYEGQTIRQRNVYGEHVKASFEIPCDMPSSETSETFAAHIVNEALQTVLEEPKGPVHINIPLREPLYPFAEQKIRLPERVRGLKNIPRSYCISETELRKIADLWNDCEKKLIVLGQMHPAPMLSQTLKSIGEKYHIPIVADILCNASKVTEAVRNHDFFLGHLSEKEREAFRPDLLITLGKSVLSKNLKIFLRKNKPEHHIHVSPGNVTADPFFSVTQRISLPAEIFLQAILNSEYFSDNQDIYFNLWAEYNQSISNKKQLFLKENTAFSELNVVHTVLHRLPKGIHLHLANSMPVRYANMLLEEGHDFQIYSNRGTCGIDGSVSTAAGAALASPDELHVLLTGDMSFFYDRNALWHTYGLLNLRIIILNNHGGDIFRMIDGPSGLPEAEKYFITQQPLNAKYTAADANAEYYFCETFSELENHWASFLHTSGKLKILEVKTHGHTNAEAFGKLKEIMTAK